MLFLIAYITTLFSGRYLLDLVSSFFHLDSPLSLSAADYLSKYKDVVGVSNYQNILFIVSVILLISIVYYLYELFLAIGRILPVQIVYTPSESVNRYDYLLRNLWPMYSDRFVEPHAFRSFVSESAKDINQNRYWSDLFRLCKSFIIYCVILMFIVPASSRKFSILEMVGLIILFSIVAIVASIVEAARYRNDRGIAVHQFILQLQKESAARVSPEVPHQVWEPPSVLYPQTRDSLTELLAHANLDLSIAYFGSVTRFIRARWPLSRDRSS